MNRTSTLISLLLLPMCACTSRDPSATTRPDSSTGATTGLDATAESGDWPTEVGTSESTGASSGTGATPDLPNELELVRSRSGFLFAPVQFTGVSGSADALAMVDFGDPTPLSISGTFAEKLGIPLTATGDTGFHADGSSFKIFEGVVPLVEVGTEQLEHVRVTSGDGELETVANAIGFPFEATVGWGFVNRYHVRFDHHGGQLSLSDQPIEPTSPEFSVEIEHASYLRIPVAMNGRDAHLVVDTGSSHNVLDRAAAEALFQSPIDSTTIPVALDVGGHTTQQHFVVQDLPVLAQLEVIGVLGAPFLRERIMYVPRGERTLTFEPR